MTAKKKEDPAIKVVEQVLEALKKNPALREQFLEVIDPGACVKRDVLAEVLDEIRQLRIENNERFETMQQQINKRFEAVDQRFEEIHKVLVAMQVTIADIS